MQYVVNRSGYSLCGPEQGHVNILFTRPLPAAQYKLGPMSLRNTLQVLAGPAWQVKVDEVVRSVCFVLRPGYQLPEGQRYAAAPAATPSTAPSKPAPASSPVVTVASVPPAKPLDTHTEPAKPVTNVATTPAVIPVPAGAALTSAPVNAPGEALPVRQSPNAPLAKGTPAKPAVAALSTAKPAAVAIPAAKSSAAAVPTASNAYALPSVRLTEPASAMTQTWDAPIGSTLRQSVKASAKRAGWQVVWEPDDLDYPIEAALHFRGTFAEAVAQVFPLYDGARRSFIVDGNSSQRIVHVSERKKS